MIRNLFHGVNVFKHPDFLLAKVRELLDDGVLDEVVLQNIASVLVEVLLL